jgi:hypothetical protein
MSHRYKSPERKGGQKTVVQASRLLYLKHVLSIVGE